MLDPEVDFFTMTITDDKIGLNKVVSLKFEGTPPRPRLL